MNRGSYLWIPDTYAATSGGDFGVMQAYYPACIDFGRPHNTLPADRGNATTIGLWGAGLRDKSGTPLGNLGDVSGSTIDGPFLRSLMRTLSTNLTKLPAGEPVGMSYFDYAKNPYYLFSTNTVGNGRVASILIDYTLYTSKEFEDKGQQGNTPLSIIALFDPDEVGDWFTLSRSDGTSIWGPPSEEPRVSSAQVTRASELLGHPVVGLHIPIPRYSAKDVVDDKGEVITPAGTKLTIPELNITSPAAYSGVTDPAKQPWNSDTYRTVSIRLGPRYFVNSSNFPRLRGILIAPNEQVSEGTTTPLGNKAPWNAIIKRIRIYDAIQTNVTPEHDEISGDQTITVKPQFPCKIFGYAWRLMHPVQMSKYTLPIQPSVGTLLSSRPGNARRTATFKFKLYHPDSQFENLGVAHSVRFYYGLAVAAMPGTSPIFGSFSLMGIMAGLAADQDLLLVQYMGPLPGHQTLTFMPLASQIVAAPGQVVWGGQFGYSRQTVGLKCFSAKASSGSSPAPPGMGTSWVDIMAPVPPNNDVNASALPSGDINGLGPLWYHQTGDTSSWYSFLSMNAAGVTSWNPNVAANYVGGFTTSVKGTPQTHINGVGAFSMGINNSETFTGGNVTTIYAKARNILANEGTNITTYCSGNMDSHIVTFVSDVRNIGANFDIFTGQWFIRFAAAVSDSSRDNTQIFYRFAFVSEAVPNADLNGEKLWTYGPEYVREFHFEPNEETGAYAIAEGTPSMANVISTPPLQEQPLTYENPISCFRAHGDGTFIWDGNTDLLESNIKCSLTNGGNGWLDGTRVVLQVWAISYARPGVALRNPTSATQYPTVEFSWGGKTESMFQTMITEVRSNAGILAQQDPVVAGYTDQLADIVVMKASPQDLTTPSAEASDYRNYPLYNQRLSLDRRFDSGVDNTSLPTSAILTTDDKTCGLSLIGVRPRSYYDPIDDASQVADTYVQVLASGDVVDAIVGGSGIMPQTVTISGSIGNNVSTFNSFVSFEIYMTNDSRTTAFPIAKTRTVPVVGVKNQPLAPTPQTRFTLTANIPQAIAVPGTQSVLMLRCKVWSYINSDNVKMTENLPSLLFVDIGDFKVQFSYGLNTISNQNYVIGTNDWYQGLNVSTARTFGSGDYFFIPDDDTVKLTIMPPATVSGYGYWYMTGWMFSPFWFIDMPEGGVFEIQDRAGLTQGNLNTGNNFVGAERYQRAMYVRTAIDTVPSTSVSSTRGGARFGPRGFIARGANTAENAGGASLGVIPIQDNSMMQGLVENLVRAGDTVLTGKNPLIVALDPDAEYMRRLRLRHGKMTPDMRMMLYEEDSFDADKHQASVAMLINYDGSGVGWQNPHGHRGSGGTDKVIMTNDMKMLGAAVDPQSFHVYVVGYRSADPNNPQNGGMIVMRTIRPRLIFGSDSAATGPLHFVDGLLREEDWDTSAPSQPLFPRHGDTNSPKGTLNSAVVIDQRPNKLGGSGTTAPAAESFPDVFADGLGNIFVFYTLLGQAGATEDQWGVTGKIFCRRSCNDGYFFERPFSVVDLGYVAARELNPGTAADDSFDIRHIVSLYDDKSKQYMLVFWSGGKVFMRIAPHPDIAANRAASQANGAEAYARESDNWKQGHRIYMVAGSTDFLEVNPSTLLDKWLAHQFTLGLQSDDVDETKKPLDGKQGGWDPNYWGDGQANNYRPKANDNAPAILLNRYSNDPDIPPQRVSAYISGNGDVVVVFMDALYKLMYKRIRIVGKYPTITPAVAFDTNIR